MWLYAWHASHVRLVDQLLPAQRQQGHSTTTAVHRMIVRIRPDIC